MRPKINPELRVEADWTPATFCKCVMETNLPVPCAKGIDSKFNVGKQRRGATSTKSGHEHATSKVNVGEDVLEDVLWREERYVGP